MVYKCNLAGWIIPERKERQLKSCLKEYLVTGTAKCLRNWCSRTLDKIKHAQYPPQEHR